MRRAANLWMTSPLTFRLPAVALIACAAASPAAASDLGEWQGFDVRWDNTLRYTAAFRLEQADGALVTRVNNDDGDRNFSPGLISNRLDLISILDLSKDDYGLHVSGTGWYDTVYHTRTDNASPLTYNALSVPFSQFPRATRNLLGQHAELGDAFIYGNFVAASVPISIRLGRQTLLWGESLFFNQNGIAAALAPYDYIKAASEPSDYSRDEYLPVNQLSVTIQPRPNLSFAFYYKFEWRPSRLPAVGSYFSYLDQYGAGSERVFADDGAYFMRGPDRYSNADQFGLSLHTAIDDLDLGFYAVQYNATYPVLKIASVNDAASGDIGTYALAYPRRIQLYGVSFSDYIADANVAGEISLRRYMPLTSTSPIAQYDNMAAADSPHHSAYAAGDTLHAQISAAMSLGPNPAWNSTDLSIEAAANDLLEVTQYARALNRTRDRFAVSVRMLAQPHYFEVLPNLDVTVPIGLGYNLAGQSSVDYTQNGGTGDVEAGFSAVYRTVWKASLTATVYFGSPVGQALADRDFIMFRVERTF